MMTLDEPIEFAALRVLCRPRFAETERGLFLGYLAQGLDWAALFQTALRHDVASLTAHRLLSLDAESLAEDMREGLALYLEGERLKARKLARELAELLACLADHHIPAIPIKGPQLALALYGDVGLRGCRDLDVLIRDADVEQTLLILEALGYFHDKTLNARQIDAVRGYGGQYILFHPKRTPVEPHWLIAPSTLAFDLDYERLWQRAQVGDFLGASCLRLPPEEELLLLCLHGAKEQWQKLKWIADIAGFVDIHPEIDWQRLSMEAAGQGCARMLNLGLILAQRLLEFPLPVEISRDFTAEQLATDIIKPLGQNPPAPPNPYRLSSYYWRMRERPRDAWAYAVRTVTTPRALHYGLLRLPAALAWGYYPIKLVWDYLLIPIWASLKKSPD